MPEVNYVAAGQWKRLTGHEIHGKTLAIIGLGRIGQEVARRGRAFGMKLIGFGAYWPSDVAEETGIERYTDLDQVFLDADFVSLHTSLKPATRHLVNARRLQLLRPGAVIVNCARGELVDTAAVVAALKSRHLFAYAADVLDAEPPPPDHPLLGLPNALITPHIGSRTFESVVRQATCAVENLTLFLAGRKPHAQANLSGK